MPIIQHNGHWYRVSSEPVVLYLPDDNSGNNAFTPPEKVIHKHQVTAQFRGAWERLGTAEFGVCSQTHSDRADHAVEDAINAVLAIPAGSA